MVILEHSVEHPLNREPPVKELISSFITDKDAFDRNHGPIPHIDVDNHILRVDGAVAKVLELTITQLKQDFQHHEIICALQCAGNRRHTMRTLLKEVDGIDWGDGAVMNCAWKGPRLRDILLRAGANSSDQKKAHAAFASFQVKCQDDDWYGGSIELERAMRVDGDVIIALEMNGRPLPVNHGFPIRIIAPGIAGARSVKWLDRITVQTTESKNFYQQYDYKILPPEATNNEAAKKHFHMTPAIQDMPVNSVIAVPQSGETLSSSSHIVVEGYALPQGDQGPVTKVEVSIDDGESWINATIVDAIGDRGKWCWTLWKTMVILKKGEDRCILSRATDAGGNVQCACPQWNLRGVAYDGYGDARNLKVT